MPMFSAGTAGKTAVAARWLRSPLKPRPRKWMPSPDGSVFRTDTALDRKACKVCGKTRYAYQRLRTVFYYPATGRTRTRWIAGSGKLAFVTPEQRCACPGPDGLPRLATLRDLALDASDEGGKSGDPLGSIGQPTNVEPAGSPVCGLESDK